MITPDMVKLKISKLKQDKAPGDDGITDNTKIFERSGGRNS